MPARKDIDTLSAQDAAVVVETTTGKREIDMTDDRPTDGGESSESPEATSEDSSMQQTADSVEPTGPRRRRDVARLLVLGLLPGLVLLLALAAGYMKWQYSSMRVAQVSGIESVAAARDGAVAILSYTPDTADKDLGAARDRLIGTFKESYTQLTKDVVIPAAKEQHIAVAATVPAAASVSATTDHAVALVFINLTTTIGSDSPTATVSSARVTLDKVDNRWLISGFDPV